MKKLTTYKLLFLALIFSFISNKSFSQSIEQDPKIEALLKEKRKINTGITINDLYKIQIFNGKKDEAIKNLTEFKSNFKEIDGTMIYNNPTFKVWVGSFKTRIEAENSLLEIKKKYPLALLIKPNK
ncbi:SPOR domain-containing protein [uncultured Flavobacterium sp.]|uniref:SPOR domain-containing protein n=1 Tax=uncultured Flavobacterium sp. TaxID=165435 RepID=UPI0030EB968A|tara:strand:+ start:51932 stop:52309 length:378 start_codon:yes stop_codon:yes gene_type:complete